MLSCFIIAGCSDGMATTDKNYLAALEQSVTQRMENADSDDYESLVNTELATLDEYREAEFSDPAIAEAAEQYFEGLDKQKEALGDVESYSEYQLLWNEGISLRYQALKSLNEQTGFMKDNEEFVAKYVMKADELTAYYNAMKEIEEDIDSQYEKEKIDFGYSFNDHSIRITLKNNTKHKFTSAWKLTMLGKDKKTVLETIEGEATANPKAKYVVTLYPSNDNWGTYTWENWYTDIKVK